MAGAGFSMESAGTIATRLADSTLDAGERHSLLQTVQQSLDWAALDDADAEKLLDLLAPMACSVLVEEDAAFAPRAADAGTFRVALLEFLGRIPMSGQLRPHVGRLMQAFLRVVMRDTDEMGARALRLLHAYISDGLIKGIIPSLAEELMGPIIGLFERICEAVREVFDDDDEAAAPAAGVDEPRRFVHGFKGMTNLPKMIASIVMSGLPMIPEAQLQRMTLALLDVLDAAPAVQLEARQAAAPSDERRVAVYVGVGAKRSAYLELKALQLKMVNPVLFYLRKSKPGLFEAHRQRLADAMLATVLEMPPESASLRREALNNIRLIVSGAHGSDLRAFFAPHLDALLDENVLLGPGVTTRVLCRYTATIVVADLVIGFRRTLSAEQTRRVFYAFCRRIHDDHIPQQAALHCFKLVILLFEHVAALQKEGQLTRDEARGFAIEFIRILAQRLRSLNALFPQVCRLHRRGGAGGDAADEAAKGVATTGGLRRIEGPLDVGVPFFRQVRAGARDSAKVIHETKMVFRLVINSVKHALAALATHWNPPPPAGTSAETWNSTARGFELDEFPLFHDLLREGLQFFDYMIIDDFDESGEHVRSGTTAAPNSGGSGGNGAPAASGTAATALSPQMSRTSKRRDVSINKEDQDAMEMFSHIFGCIDPAVFQDVMKANLDHVFALTVRNDYIAFFLQHFVLLSTNNTSFNISSMLFGYMRTHLDDLGRGDVWVAAALIRWLKLICSGMAVYGSRNDTILLPHLAELIMSCIKLPRTAQDPYQFFAFLRILFRSISGGKFEALYNQIVPIMPELLDVLSQQLASAHRLQLKEILVELILTVPVRLSHLLPYLSYLMRPLVFALQQRHGELVSHALRTLDLILDNLADQYLHPILTPYREELMAALFRHLRPPPYRSGLSHPTVKLLGKLSGRSRRWIKDPPELAFHEYTESGLEAFFGFVASGGSGAAQTHRLAFDRALETIRVLLDTPNVDVRYKQLGFEFVRGCVPLVIELDSDADLDAAYRQLDQQVAAFLASGGNAASGQSNASEWAATEGYAGPALLTDKRAALDKAVATVVECVALACASPEIAPTAEPLLHGLGRHFALLELQEFFGSGTLRGPNSAVAAAAAAAVAGGPSGATTPVALTAPSDSSSTSSTATRARARQQLAVDAAVNRAPSRSDGFVEGVSKVFFQDDAGRRAVGEALLQTVRETAVEAAGGGTGGERLAAALPLWLALADKLCAACDKTPWFVKTGAVAGLRFLVRDLELGRPFVLAKQQTLAKALLHLVRDPAPEMVARCALDAQTLLSEVIRAGHLGESGHVRPLVNQLVLALADSSRAVRQTVQTALAELATATGLSVYSLVAKGVGDRLVQPIFAKPLRALPFPKQIGNIEAITFCLNQQPVLVPLSDAFQRFMVEVLSIADAEDQGLLSKAQKPKSASLLVELRVACLKFLAVARTHPDLVSSGGSSKEAPAASGSGATASPAAPGSSTSSTSQSSTEAQQSTQPPQAQGATETRVFSIYLKYLVYSDHEQVVQAAMDGLKVLMRSLRLPKEILPQALKPILQNLGNPKDLQIQSLAALKRLLDPLISFFKAELGNRLLDHLRYWAERADLDDASRRYLQELEPVRLMVAILDIFTALSGAAGVFLGDLVTIVVERLDPGIRRTSSSPFRQSLLRYLAKYADATVTFFIERLDRRPYVALLLDALSQVDEVRGRLVARLDEVATAIGDGTDAERVGAAARIVGALCRVVGVSVLRGQTPLMQAFVAAWQALPHDAAPTSETRERATALLEVLMAYWEAHPDDLGVIDLVVEAAQHHALVLDAGPVHVFLYAKLLPALATSPVRRRAVLEHFLRQCAAGATAARAAHGFLTLVVSPMLAAGAAAASGGVVDERLGAMVAQRVWEASTSEAAAVPQPLASATGVETPRQLSTLHMQEQLRLELQGFTYSLLLYAPDAVAPIRKEIIKYAWLFMKAHDSLLKASAALVTAKFIEAYDTPARISCIVYTNLIQSAAPESLPLVRQGLALLTPILGQRLFHDAAYTQRLVAQLGRAIRDEPAFGSVMLDVFAAHASVWAPWRATFAPLFLGVLVHVGGLQAPPTPPSSSSSSSSAAAAAAADDARQVQLAVSLTEVLLSWRVSPAGLPAGTPAKRAAPEDEAASADLADDGDGETAPTVSTTATDMPAETDDAITGFLVRVAAHAGSGGAWQDAASRALGLFEQALEAFPDSQPPIGLVATLLPGASDSAAAALVELLASGARMRGGAAWIAEHETEVAALLQRHVATADVSPAVAQAAAPLVAMASEHLASLSENTVEEAVGKSAPMDVESDAEMDLGDDAGDEDADEEGTGVSAALGVTMGPTLTSETPAGTSDIKIDPATAGLKGTLEAFFAGALEKSRLGRPQTWTALVLLEAYVSGQPGYLDGFLPVLVKHLQSLVREHVAQRAPAVGTKEVSSSAAPLASAGTPAVGSPAVAVSGTATPNAATASTSAASASTATQQLLVLLQLLPGRVREQAPLRKSVWQQLGTLVEKSVDLTLLRALLRFAERSVFDADEREAAAPTLKEKAVLLAKMYIFEFRGDRRLVDEYLQLVLRIYSDDSLRTTELASHLENAFLLGVKSENYELRRQFASKWDASLARALPVRLSYLLGVQRWEPLANTFWIRQMVDMVLGSVDASVGVSGSVANYRIRGFGGTDEAVDSAASPKGEALPEALKRHMEFIQSQRTVTLDTLIQALRQVVYVDNSLAAEVWVQLFPLCWTALAGDGQRSAVGTMLVQLLVKEYHVKQADMRPNCVQTLMEAAARCYPTLALPPAVVRACGSRFNAWHAALEMLQNSAPELRAGPLGASRDEERVREQVLDATEGLYRELGEEDLALGLWRRRCSFGETNAALALEQLGEWAAAQKVLERAQACARAGSVPYCEAEFAVWEEHWIRCAKKLQQWDLLADLAKQEGNHALLLECAWRLSDFGSEREHLERTFQALGERRSLSANICETFHVLVNGKGDDKGQREFAAAMEETVQLALRRWHALPAHAASGAHRPLLHAFQLLMELGDARQIQTSLLQTGASNVESKAAEIKAVLDRWRWRLPNAWDDVEIWSDLVAWRQHVFAMLNKKYVPIAQSIAQLGAAQNVSYLYKGYHETAWIINRFAHVLRKSGMPDVCLAQLNKIYTLPNIEIQEAFYKLREHAKCYMDRPADYVAGLEVINNTNMTYFLAAQKAEFMTLRGQFFALLGRPTDAFQSFSQGLRLSDLAKGWQQWGLCNNQLFRERPQTIEYGIHAMECCLKAANVYNNHEARRMLARCLWLLILDERPASRLTGVFTQHAQDTPVWYWIAFIPQLLNGLANGEWQACKLILLRLAKTYPQALFFPLRAMADDLMMYRRQLAHAGGGSRGSRSTPSASTPSASENNGAQPMSVDTPGASGNSTQATLPAAATPATPATPVAKTEPADEATPTAQQPPKQPAQKPPHPTEPWKHCDDIAATLKTASPLLALSMETLCDQIIMRMKLTMDEDIYRLIVTFYNEQSAVLAARVLNPRDSLALSPQTQANLVRFAGTMYPNHVKYQRAFQREFIDSRPDLPQLLARLQKWRDHLELVLDSRPERYVLTHFSQYLAEYEYNKFDEVEVPGQYLALRDSNVDFIRIDSIEPTFAIYRGHTACFRRLTFRGHDGHAYPFKIVSPTPRSSRREERLVQFYTFVNGILEHRRECRRRGLRVQLAELVPICNVVRLAAADPSYRSMYQVYEYYCAKAGLPRDAPFRFQIQKLMQLVRSPQLQQLGPNAVANLKTDLLRRVCAEMVPDTAMTAYFARKMKTLADLWLLRKQFTASLAANEFMNYTMAIANRTPQKLLVSTRTGQVLGEELWPNFSASEQIFRKDEPAPFRLTPNIQSFMTLVGLEGVYATLLVVLARSCLERRAEDLEAYLPLLMRDALIFYSTGYCTPVKEGGLANYIYRNTDAFLQRLDRLACGVRASAPSAGTSAAPAASEAPAASSASQQASPTEKAPAGAPPAAAKPPADMLPVNHMVLELIAASTNPANLAAMDPNWMPYF